MTKRVAILSLALSSILLAATLGPVAFADEARQPLWQPASLGAGNGGVYFLTEDLSTSSGHVIEIVGTGVEDVVIDLNGFRVEGPSSTIAVDVEGLRSFTLRNGAVSCKAGGFFGVRVIDAGVVTVEDVEIGGCNTGLLISRAAGFAVRRNTILGSVAGTGIWISNFLAPARGRGVVEENTVRVDANYGILIDSSAETDAITVLNNRIEAGNIAGLLLSGTGFLVSGNIVTRCQGNGISLDGPVSGVRLFDNVISMNDGAGISLGLATHCRISDNVINNNGNDGIYIEDSSKIVIDGNLLTDNAFSGIKLRTSATDAIYRGNVARGNAFASGACAGNPPACGSPDICDDGGTGNVSGGDNYLPGPC